MIRFISICYILISTGTPVVYRHNTHQGAVTGGNYDIDSFSLTIWDDIGFNPYGSVWDFDTGYVQGMLVGPSDAGFVDIYYEG